jgi:hypothetical protein
MGCGCIWIVGKLALDGREAGVCLSMRPLAHSSVDNKTKQNKIEEIAPRCYSPAADFFAHLTAHLTAGSSFSSHRLQGLLSYIPLANFCSRFRLTLSVPS